MRDRGQVETGLSGLAAKITLVANGDQFAGYFVCPLEERTTIGKPSRPPPCGDLPEPRVVRSISVAFAPVELCAGASDLGDCRA